MISFIRTARIIHPVNLFMNTRIASDGKITINRPLPEAGDKIVLRALTDCVLGVSACSVSECDTNGGKCTAVAVQID